MSDSKTDRNEKDMNMDDTQFEEGSEERFVFNSLELNRKQWTKNDSL